MRLGTVLWMEGMAERLALVSPLPDGRFVDLNRIEHVRLAKLGESAPDRLAAVLVPPSLRQVLEGGPRAMARVKQTVQYAEKWARRGDLPGTLAYPPDRVRVAPCVPRPTALRTAEGAHLDRLKILGSDVVCLDQVPEAGLAAIGQAGGEPGGFCLAFRVGDLVALGDWLLVDEPFGGELTLRAGSHKRTASLSIYEGLELPPLCAGEALLLPPIRFRTFPGLDQADRLELVAPFDTLVARLLPGALHGTVQ